MEAVVDSDQVNAISEPFRLQVIFILGEWFKADRATAPDCIVVPTDALSQILVHLVEEPINLLDLLLLVAVRLQTLNDVSLQHVDLVIIKALG